jgi:hypothetical protein
VFGKIEPDIDYQMIDNIIYEALTNKSARFTGNELRFVRLHSKLTLKAFGEKFDVSHAGVKNWEDAGDNLTRMKWACEIAIRIFMMNEIQTKPMKFLEHSRRLLDGPEPGKSKAFRVNAENMELIEA